MAHDARTFAPSTLDAARHAAQQRFIDSADDLVVGSVAHLPWTAPQLAGNADALPVRQRLDSGLTAVVYRLQGPAHDYTLKRARPQARVHNPDGQTSFLNEVQRRADFERLKRRPGGEQRWQAIVDTHYASFRQGVILSPWIDGQPVTQWDEPRLSQLLALACALWLEGLFEWDLCSGNILDEHGRLRLFDFGYMYRFDPRRQFNTAGRGDDEPLFHPAERFETRNFCALLLQLEQAGSDAALAAFRLEKQIALQAYEQMRQRVATMGASAAVLAWLDTLMQRWREALRGDLGALYLAENWRSHVLDLDDDLRGRSCTPMTLRRADWLLAALREHFDALQRLQAFFWGDAGLSRPELLARYAERRRQAERFQIDTQETDR